MTDQTSEIRFWIYSSRSAGPCSNSGRLRKKAVADDLECTSKSSISANLVVANGFDDLIKRVRFFGFGRWCYWGLSGSSDESMLSMPSVPAESFSAATMALALAF